MIDDKYKVGIIIEGDDTISFGYVGKVEADTFDGMYAKWKELTEKWELSMEYVKDEWVYLLAYKQLHSGVDRIYNQIIRHNDVPRLRPSRVKAKDLKLRKATERDYGTYEPSSSSHVDGEISDIIIRPEWIRRWRARAACIRFYRTQCGGWLPYEYEVDTVWRAFLLTINDIHEAMGSVVPQYVNLYQVTALDPCLKPLTCYGDIPLMVDVTVTEDLARTIQDPWNVYNLDRHGNCLLRERWYDVIDLYNLARPYYLP